LELGKLLCILGGIITLIATYLFAWFVVDIAGTLYYGHGLGVLFSLPTTFADAATIAAGWGPDVPVFAIYIVGGTLIFFLFSGVFIFLGVKNRVIPVIGAVMPLLIAIAALFGPSSAPPNLFDYIRVFSGEAFVEGIFPINIVIGPTLNNASVSLGNYLLLGGGILGVLGGIWPRK
jgi:hypothetical protein